MSAPRYIVRESEGYAIRPGAVQAGGAKIVLEALVMDALDCYRVVGRWITNDRALSGPTSAQARREHVRAAAFLSAARLNAEHDARSAS